MTDKHGAIVRDAGSFVFVTDLEADRMDCKRAVRIILRVIMPGLCSLDRKVLRDDNI